MNELYILGTKFLAEEFFAIAEHGGIPVAGFVENEDRSKAGTLLFDRPIIWVDDVPMGARCVCALSTMTRKYFISQLEGRVEYGNLIHPSSIILPRATLGEGTSVSCGAIIATQATIGKHVFINRGVRIGHHTRIGNFSVIQPGANIAGLLEVGEETYVGMGAIIIGRLKVGNGSIIAAGAVVTKDVPDHVLVAGNPAVIKKENIEVP